MYGNANTKTNYFRKCHILYLVQELSSLLSICPRSCNPRLPLPWYFNYPNDCPLIYSFYLLTWPHPVISSFFTWSLDIFLMTYFRLCLDVSSFSVMEIESSSLSYLFLANMFIIFYGCALVSSNIQVQNRTFYWTLDTSRDLNTIYSVKLFPL